MPRQRLQHELELQTGQLRRVLAEHQLDGRMVAGELHHERGGRRTFFDVLDAGLAQVKALTQDLQKVFRESAVQVEEQDGRLQIYLAGEQPPVPLLDVLAALPEVPPLTAVLGWTVADQPVLLNLTSEEATHLLIAGQVGAGKTTLLRSIALSLALHNRERDVQLVLIDGRLYPTPASHTTLHSFNYLPHMLTPVVEDLQSARDTLLFLVDEVQHRQSQRVQTPAIVVMVDHVVSLLEQGGRELLHALTYLVRQGGAVGMHLLLATRRPTSPHLNDLYDAYLPARLVGRVANAAEAEIAADALNSGAENLRGMGDFVAVVGNLSTHFQAAAVSEYDLHYALEELYEQRPPVVVALPFNPRPHKIIAEPPARYNTPMVWEGEPEEEEAAELPLLAKRTAVSPPPVYQVSDEDEDWEEEAYEEEEEAGLPLAKPAAVPRPISLPTAVSQVADEDDEADWEEEDEEEEMDEWVDEPEKPFAPGVWLRAEPVPFPPARTKTNLPPSLPAIPTKLSPPRPIVPEAPKLAKPLPPPLPDDDIPFTWESPRFQPELVEEAELEPPTPRPTQLERRQTRPRFNQVRSLLKTVDQSLEENPPTPPVAKTKVEFAVDEVEEEAEEPEEEGAAEQPVEEILLEQFDDGWASPPPTPPTADEEPTSTTIRVTSGQSAVLRYPASLQRQRKQRFQ